LMHTYLADSTLLLLLSRPPRPPIPTLFPYTTLFRSAAAAASTGYSINGILQMDCNPKTPSHTPASSTDTFQDRRKLPTPPARRRSEEHTSELQSRFDLVCRLLLEKKKKRPSQTKAQQ